MSKRVLTTEKHTAFTTVLLNRDLFMVIFGMVRADKDRARLLRIHSLPASLVPDLAAARQWKACDRYMWNDHDYHRLLHGPRKALKATVLALGEPESLVVFDGDNETMEADPAPIFRGSREYGCNRVQRVRIDNEPEPQNPNP